MLLSGHMSGLFQLMLWLPRAVRDWLLARKFGLNRKVSAT
jgi:hypothetical protein